MRREAWLTAAIVALAGCATAQPRPEPPPGPDDGAPVTVAPPPTSGDESPRESDQDLPHGEDEARPSREDAEEAPAPSKLRRLLAARARTFLGQRGPFRVGHERFTPDCSGFVSAVYAAEGIDLRGAMQRAAPQERRGAKAAWLAAMADGSAFGADERPAPGDLVFWHDTYDRNRNRKVDDRFTHVGIVERVEGGSVHFIHRGGKGVARGVMTLARPHEATGGDGRRLNSTLRARSHPVKRAGLAAELFAGFSRPDDPSPAHASTPRARDPARSGEGPRPASGRRVADR